jgi:hypothetical protein
MNWSTFLCVGPLNSARQLHHRAGLIEASLMRRHRSRRILVARITVSATSTPVGGFQSYRILSELGSAVLVAADAPNRLLGYVPRNSSKACSQNGLPPFPLLVPRVWLGEQSRHSLQKHAESWCLLVSGGFGVRHYGFHINFMEEVLTCVRQSDQVHVARLVGCSIGMGWLACVCFSRVRHREVVV